MAVTHEGVDDVVYAQMLVLGIRVMLTGESYSNLSLMFSSPEERTASESFADAVLGLAPKLSTPASIAPVSKLDGFCSLIEAGACWENEIQVLL